MADDFRSHWSREKRVAYDAWDELDRATRKFGPMKSAHEGWAVIWEELDELWECVRAQNHDYVEMRKEAIQVAAMALRFAMDVCDTKEETN